MDSRDRPEPGPTEIRVELEYPIQVGGQTVRELVLARPKMRHLRAIESEPGGELERTARAVAELTGLSRRAVDEIDATDVARIGEALAKLVGKVLPTGETS